MLIIVDAFIDTCIVISDCAFGNCCMNATKHFSPKLTWPRSFHSRFTCSAKLQIFWVLLRINHCINVENINCSFAHAGANWAMKWQWIFMWSILSDSWSSKGMLAVCTVSKRKQITLTFCSFSAAYQAFGRAVIDEINSRISLQFYWQ